MRRRAPLSARVRRAATDFTATGARARYGAEKAEIMPSRKDVRPGDLSDREIVSTRTFDAPRERVFEAFSDPSRVARWWGPSGFTNTVHEFDMRPGGTWWFTMHGPDGADYPSESVFVDIVKPERIAFQHLSADH